MRLIHAAILFYKWYGARHNWLLGFWCVFALYLVEALDSSGTYATHSHRYAWFLTVAYIRGMVHVGLLRLAWLVAIGLVLYSDNKSCRWYWFIDWCGVCFECWCRCHSRWVVYDSTQQASGALVRFGLKLCVSIFNLVYATIAIPLLSRKLRNVAANSSFVLCCWQSTTWWQHWPVTPAFM